MLVSALIKVPEAVQRRNHLGLSCPGSMAHYPHCTVAETFLTSIKWCESFPKLSSRRQDVWPLILALWEVCLGTWRGRRPWTSGEQSRGRSCARGGLWHPSKEISDYPAPVLLHPWQLRQGSEQPGAVGNVPSHCTKWPLGVPCNPNHSKTPQFHEGPAQCGSTFLQNGLQGAIHINCLCRNSLQTSQVQAFDSSRPWQRSWAWHSTLLPRECCHWSDSLPSGCLQSGSMLVAMHVSGWLLFSFVFP